jgi:hypothetical protein
VLQAERRLPALRWTCVLPPARSSHHQQPAEPLARQQRARLSVRILGATLPSQPYCRADPATHPPPTRCVTNHYASLPTTATAFTYLLPFSAPGLTPHARHTYFPCLFASTTLRPGPRDLRRRAPEPRRRFAPGVCTSCLPVSSHWLILSPPT